MKYIKLFEKSENLGESLIGAVRNIDLNKIEELINSGVDLNYQDSNGDTALIWAVANDNFVIVELLIDAGANLFLRSKYDYDFYDLSYIIGNDKRMKEFIEKKVPDFITIKKYNL